MAITRRSLVRGLGLGVLGAGALSACEGGRRGGSRGQTTPPPSAGALVEPEQPLVIGSIGASYGRMAKFEDGIAIAIDVARIDVNARWEGLFGQEIVLVERHVMAAPDEDLAPVIQQMAESGVTCVITSIDEESLIAAIPSFVEHQMTVIDLFSSGMQVRAEDVQTSNLLVRLAPNDATIAAMYAELALGASSDRGGAPGTIAYLSEDTLQGRSLLSEIERVLNPASGRVVSQQLYAVGDFGDVAARVGAVLETPPALLVLNGGAEAAPFLSALREATLDEGGRPSVEFPVRVAPWAVIDYAQEEVAGSLAAESLSTATGFEPGGEITVDHENMMLNRDASFLQRGYAYTQQGYDAVVIACLAAQQALSVEGPALAAAIPRVLTGSEDCTDYSACRQVLTTAVDAGQTATISYSGRMGDLELGPRSDARVGQMRTYTWSEANALEGGSAAGFEAPA